jgi:LPS O-antigen subunit length determinant protein (WzzB/FepE family)
MSNKIHFKQIIYKIWKEKLLIFLISIAFSLLAYFLSLSLTKRYSAEIVLNNPPFYLFDDYTSSITKTTNDYFNQLLTSEINKNLLDINNLEKFIDQSTEFNSFKIFLKSRNISVKEYFRKNKIGIKQDGFYKFIISINYTNDLEGKLFLESYIKYTKDISIVQFKKTLKILISNRINEINKFLVFLEDEQDTEFKNSISKNKNDSSVYYTNVQLNRLNKKLDDDSFDYNILHSINSNQQIIDKDKESIAYSLLGLIFGLFLSLAFIFLRN